jgi:hypothetical protein
VWFVYGVYVSGVVALAGESRCLDGRAIFGGLEKLEGLDSQRSYLWNYSASVIDINLVASDISALKAEAQLIRILAGSPPLAPGHSYVYWVSLIVFDQVRSTG